MAFYTPNVLDADSGFYQNFYDDGTVFAPDAKHLVSSCRMVVNFCLAEELFGAQPYRELWQHGLKAIREVHGGQHRQGYVWTLDSSGVTNDRHYCYGLAFVVLAFASAHQQGDTEAKNDLYRVWQLLEDHFWQADIGLYADEISNDWQFLDPYRGQNANMHCCEAFIRAYEVTGDSQFLDRAMALAHTITITLAQKSGGFIWEHFYPDLSINWDYNREDPKNLYRPWGFQPGHQTEWSKLLLQLYQHRPDAWLLARARALFDTTMPIAWDKTHGGLIYGFAPDKAPCDTEKYFWVQAESLAAAGLLAVITGEAAYWHWYEKLWHYSWDHFVDHDAGAWFRVLTEDNQKISNRKSEAGAKCDYHTVGACALLFRVLKPA